MIYLSILLIIFGIMLLIYTYYLGKGHVKVYNTSPNKQSFANYSSTSEDNGDYKINGDFDYNSDVDDNINISKQSLKEKNGITEINESEINLTADELDLPLDDYNPTDEEIISKEKIFEVSAVLFEDKSSIIDYNKESGSIDPSLEEYKKIKRIGKGILVIENEGINFYVDKKFFRFDFHRVSDFRCGNNFIALLIQGSSSVKLFIISEGNNSILTIEDLYKNFLKNKD